MPALAAHETSPAPQTDDPARLRRGRIVVVLLYLVFAAVLVGLGVALSSDASTANLAWVFWVGAGVVAAMMLMVHDAQEIE
jgi:hypothetical protein